jgi:poly(hydroxyalkanoate) depolymerase family esterase
MNNSFSQGMARATELTRAGKLDEATALIQSLLAGRDPALPALALPDPQVIDASFTRIDAAKPAEKPAAKPTRKARTAPRTGLGDTLRGLAAKRPIRARATHQMDGPPGARILSLTHRGAQGSRDYRLYIPARATDAPMPLVVMLHGCTQSPEDFAIGTGMNALAEESGVMVAWPAQPPGANAQKCWNWFRPEDQARDQGEPALIAGIVADILRDHAADPTRVYAAGLSAGGAAAAILGATYPDVFAAVGVHSGLAVGAAQDVMSALGAMRSGAVGDRRQSLAPTIVLHGLADTTVHPDNGDAVLAQVARGRSGLHKRQVAGVSPGGRRHTRTVLETAQGVTIAEHWQIDGAGHAWSGGHAGGSYTDPSGPDATHEMLRFFAQHRLA